MHSFSWKTRWVFLLSICLFLWPASALFAQQDFAGPDKPAEYMVYQYPGVALVIRVDIPETEFTSEIYGTDQALLRASAVPGARLIPIYQFIDSPDRARQIMIKITPKNQVDRDLVGLELIQLNLSDPNNGVLVQGYRLMSTGMQRSYSNDTSTWTSKVYSLRSAASTWAHLGWEEMRLWSEYASAHLVMEKLDDELSALELAGLIQQQSRRSGDALIELGARVLEADALIQGAERTSGDVSHGRSNQALTQLMDTSRMAKEMGLLREQSRALFKRGLVLEQLGETEQAVAQYDKALEVAVRAGHVELSNEIRSTAAVAYESMGSTAGAIGMLEEIEAQDSGEEELTLYDSLHEKGRLLNNDFRFAEAAEALQQSLQLRRADPESGPWGPTALALAWSWYSLGYEQESLVLVEDSLQRTPPRMNRAALARAHGSNATTHRLNGDFALMEQERQRQADMLDGDFGQAELLLQQGLDTWARDGAGSNEARRRLQRVSTVARQSGEAGMDALSNLYLCLLQVDRNAGACTADQANGWLESLEQLAEPSLFAEGRFAWARIQQKQGRPNGAVSVLEDLLQDISYYREVLPGVLGAWYWQHRGHVARLYLDVSLSQAGASQQRFVDGGQVLRAFEWVREIGNQEVSAAGQDPRQSSAAQDLRTLIGRAADGQDSDRSRARTALVNFRRQGGGGVSKPTREDLGGVLRTLTDDESLLTFYFSQRAVYALVGRRNGVRLLKLPRPERILSEVTILTDLLGSGDIRAVQPLLASLGELMLQPIRRELPETIYLLSAGPMTGMPLDALKLDGEYLALRHQVVNLVRLESLTNRLDMLNVPWPERVFLAGNPQDSQELFSYDIRVSQEMARVTNRFVGPGLNIIQGVALGPDEFQDERFARSDLIHLAVPGTLNLGFPERSRLRLSGTQSDPGSGILNPDDLPRVDLSARLVVMSGTGVEGDSPSGFDSRLGFVSELLGAGAGAVISTLWPAGDETTALLLDEFYQELQTSGNVLDSLMKVRRKRIMSGEEYEFEGWAGFRLYIR